MNPAQKKEPPPQTARQALLEMLVAKTPGAFEKHLPLAVRELMEKEPGLLPVHEIADGIHGLSARGQVLETFETGPILARAKDAASEQSVEITVESETDWGDAAEMEVAVHVYRAGRPVLMPFVPTMTCRMKMDEKVWRLDEVAVKLRVPLSDPEFLDGLKQRFGTATQQQRDAVVLRHLRMLTSAESAYAAAYPGIGFTCSLSDLAGSDAGRTGPRAAMLIDDEEAKPLVDGYVYVLSDCAGSPVNHFRLAGVPENPESGQRAFCSDESGEIHYADNGQAASCLEGGEQLP